MIVEDGQGFFMGNRISGALLMKAYARGVIEVHGT